MIKIKIIAFLTIVLFYMSCSDNENIINIQMDRTYDIELTNEQMLSIKDDVLLPFSEEDILNMVANFNSGDLKASKIQKLTIQDKYYKTFTTSDRTKSRGLNIDSLTIYNIKITSEDGDGFSLVSADRRVSGVIVHIPVGDINDTVEQKGFTTMLSLSYNILEANAKYYNQIVDSLKQSTIKKICIIENITKDNYYENVDYYVNKYTDIKYLKDNNTLKSEDDYSYLINKKHWPSLKTVWGQGYPYNAKAPYDCPGKPSSAVSNTDYKDKASAGCVAIAAGQVIAHYRKRYKSDDGIYTNYNYDAFMDYLKVPTTDTLAANEVSRFIADIGKQVGMNYTCSGSSASSLYATQTIMKRNYGLSVSYIDTYWRPYHLSTIFENDGLIYARGADANGAGRHAWIIDGSSFGQVYMGNNITNYNYYVHCNFGWNGAYNGNFIIATTPNPNPPVSFRHQENIEVYNIFNFYVDGWQIFEGGDI